MNIKIFLLALALLSLTVACNGSDKVVTVATLGDYAPFCEKIKGQDADGVFAPGSDSKGLRGYSWDVFRESFHAMGYTIKLLVAPWPRAMMNVKNGSVDVLFPAGKNAERQKIFYYSKELMNMARVALYVRNDNPIEWTGLDSMKGLTIGVKSGFYYGEKWNSLTTVSKQKVRTIIQGFRMLELKRLDGFIGYEVNWDCVLDQAGLKHKYRKLPVFDSTTEYVVALKTNENALEILDAYDAGKRLLFQSGKLLEIKEKWYGEADLK